MLYSILIGAAAFNAPLTGLSSSRVASAPCMVTGINPKGFGRQKGDENWVSRPFGSLRTGGFWQTDEWKAKQGLDGSAPPAAAAPAAAAPAAAAAPSAEMTVAQACAFLADPSIAGESFEAKKAYLASKGVSDFVISEAACTAPDTTLVL